MSVATSTMEAEYYAMSLLVHELMWLQSLLNELSGRENSAPACTPCQSKYAHLTSTGQLPPPIATTIKCDNRAAVHLATGAVLTSKSKHIRLRHHAVREYVEGGYADVEWVAGSRQLADILTKPLHKDTFIPLRNNIMNQ